jgi:hypothetical protein
MPEELPDVSSSVEALREQERRGGVAEVVEPAPPSVGPLGRGDLSATPAGIAPGSVSRDPPLP